MGFINKKAATRKKRDKELQKEATQEIQDDLLQKVREVGFSGFLHKIDASFPEKVDESVGAVAYSIISHELTKDTRLSEKELEIAAFQSILSMEGNDQSLQIFGEVLDNIPSIMDYLKKLNCVSIIKIDEPKYGANSRLIQSAFSYFN